MQQRATLPFIVHLFAALGVAMLVPGLYALAIGERAIADTFLLDGGLVLALAAILGLSLLRRRRRTAVGRELGVLLTAYVVLPALAALPFGALLPTISYGDAYFEMLSALTTTGATLFDDPTVLAAPLNLWRAIVAWLGGLMILVAAIAIMEPLNIGGFEVRSTVYGARPGEVAAMVQVETDHRLGRALRTIAPIYAVLTFALTTILLMLGDPALVATTHAMAILSTSGVSATGGLETTSSGMLGEAAMFAFLCIAISNRFLPRGGRVLDIHKVTDDPEVRIAAVVVLSVTLVLFSRHFAGAVDVGGEGNIRAAVTALWGNLFTLLSFLTTTGFASSAWGDAQGWSGLETSGLVLFALAMLGGGIATTAGGVKLLRIFALQKHGFREMERLIHPSSIGGFGTAARRIRREGAFIAWIFLMIFFLSLAGIVVLLTLTDVPFEAALVLAVATLTNTGPLAAQFGEAGISYRALLPDSHMILNASMILGRVEVLAFVSLLNVDFWRR